MEGVTTGNNIGKESEREGREKQTIPSLSPFSYPLSHKMARALFWRQLASVLSPAPPQQLSHLLPYPPPFLPTVSQLQNVGYAKSYYTKYRTPAMSFTAYIQVFQGLLFTGWVMSYAIQEESLLCLVQWVRVIRDGLRKKSTHTS